MRVSISMKAARELLLFAQCNLGPCRELEAAIAKASRASSTRVRLRKPKQQKRAQKKQETADIWMAVAKRADGRCESCGGNFVHANPMELDHFFSRSKLPQSITTCWGLHASCHARKTRNEGGAAWWLKDFARHCDRHGYASEHWRALSRLEFVSARSALSTHGGGR